MSDLSPSQHDLIQQARALALRYLAARPRSVAELAQKLGRRFPQGLAGEAVAQLEREGLLDDSAFARFWAEMRLRTHPRSAALVRAEIVGKGVSREMADQAVVGLDDDSTALRLATHYARRLGQVDYSTFSRKVGPYLARRGFGEAVVRRTLRHLWAEGQEIHQSAPEPGPNTA
ncbi:MAG: regulatory protein RecX [Chloroflexi bacterium]|nr:regulatory protein RecX [Chloroflexota bacterium]